MMKRMFGRFCAASAEWIFIALKATTIVSSSNAVPICRNAPGAGSAFPVSRTYRSFHALHSVYTRKRQRHRAFCRPCNGGSACQLHRIPEGIACISPRLPRTARLPWGTRGKATNPVGVARFPQHNPVHGHRTFHPQPLQGCIDIRAVRIPRVARHGRATLGYGARRPGVGPRRRCN